MYCLDMEIFDEEMKLLFIDAGHVGISEERKRLYMIFYFSRKLYYFGTHFYFSVPYTLPVLW